MRIFILLLLLCGSVQAANLDAKLMVLSDLHHSQLSDELGKSIVPLIEIIQSDVGIIPNWLGLGDIIDTSAGDRGPYSANDSDIRETFESRGITFKSVTGNHDISGGTPIPPVFPGPYWAWDIGNKWRVLAMEANDELKESLGATKLSWLSDQITQAATDGRYVIIATHFQLGTTRTPPTQILTPSGTTGTVTVTSNQAGTFGTGSISQRLYIKQGSCEDTSCWGWGTMVGCDGGATCTTGTTATINVVQPFVNTNPSDDWGFLAVTYTMVNSAQVRTILEQEGSTVKLALSGHSHQNGSWEVNGIGYKNISGSQDSGTLLYGKAKTGALLYLYDDGAWKLRGTAGQTSYNWGEYYLDTINGDDDYHGGTFLGDAWKTYSKVSPFLTDGTTLNTNSDINGDITLNGASGSLVGIKKIGSIQPTINGDIDGSYISLDGINIGSGYTISASQSEIKHVRILQ